MRTFNKVTIPSSKFRPKILDVLKQEGYISDYKVSSDQGNIGNPIGMASNLSFTGSGELDNGNAFSVTVAHSDKNVWSAAQISLDIGSLGTLKIDQGGGTGLDRLDDEMPSAKTASHGTGITTGIVTVTGVGGGTDIEMQLGGDMLPEGTSAYIAYSPRADGTAPNDKAGGGASATDNGAGWDVVIDSTSFGDGLRLFAGYSSIDQEVSQAGDHDSYVVGGTYAIGSVTLGYQHSKDDFDNATGTTYYENDAYAVSFAVNDNLSLSVGEHKSDRNSLTAATNVELKSTSIQASYTMGGATIAIAESSVDNAAYGTAATADIDRTTVWLSLAF